MVFAKVDQELVYGFKLSSVGPGRVTGSDVVHDLSGMDIAMKLHYVKVLYFFSSQAAQGLSLPRFKETVFECFCDFYYTSGRLRRSESGRPYIKCNDCGARFIEAYCDMTIDECLEMKGFYSDLQKLLVSQQVIGPELTFSPPVLIQFTRFKCGGISVGLSWAHILGDAFSAANFMNRWGQIMATFGSNNTPANLQYKSNTHDHERSKNPTPVHDEPLSLKWVDPVGDHWIVSNNCRMDTFSFHITASQLATLHSETSAGRNRSDQVPIFESICAIIWKCIAKVKLGEETAQARTVTICKSDPRKPTKGVVTNTQIISSVTLDSSVTETDPKRLVTLLVNEAVDERIRMEEVVERDDGVSDFIVYGANLTFVDLKEADLYGFELNGYKPDLVYCTVNGVGDEGAVFVLPAGPEGSGQANGGGGRMVTIIFKENLVPELKTELAKKGLGQGGGHDLT
ncbi:protein ECERIFERUM 26-like [Juglans microcarpa x Juglans regia]|uniref:protein ECERIFERUM 26-like n=1 Tax=Juglans microcarpa x Juglans regia TaxID=2249226 RepID=UPI001B7EF51B|nr:protein ECERIFERUM 26-like [Juglans microcarpa x Juglans regia]